MTIDKRMSYVNQDGYQNYTKNSDSVTVPRKFKSRADATPTKLAYITAAEEKQLKKQNKGTPHKGPSGIPSYDDFDAKGNYRSGAAMSAAETGGRTERARADMRQAGIGPAEAQALRSAAINAGAGQRVNPGFFDSSTHLTPQEIRAARNARRDPTNKYGAQSYRNTGQSGIMNLITRGGFFGNLLRGLGQKFGLGKKYNEPTYDMSEFNNLPLGGTAAFENLDIRDKFNRKNAKIQDTAFSKTLSDPFKYGVGPVPPSDKYKYSRGPQEVNVPDSPEGTSWDWMNNPVSNFIKGGGEAYYDLTQGENAPPDNPDKWQLARDTWPIYKQGLVDSGVGKWGEELQEDVSNKGWRDTISDRLMNTAGDDYSWRDATTWDIPFTDATIGDAFKGVKNIGEELGNRMNPIPEYTAEELLATGQLKNPFINYEEGATGTTYPGESWGNVNNLSEIDNQVSEVTPQTLGQLKALGIYKPGKASGYSMEEAQQIVPGTDSITNDEWTEILQGTFEAANGGLATLFTRRG